MGKLTVELTDKDEDGREMSDCRQRMVVTYDGKVILDQYEGEPEDNSFSRDWSFLPSFIEEVYNIGLKDGGSPQAATEQQAA